MKIEDYGEYLIVTSSKKYSLPFAEKYSHINFNYTLHYHGLSESVYPYNDIPKAFGKVFSITNCCIDNYFFTKIVNGKWIWSATINPRSKILWFETSFSSFRATKVLNDNDNVIEVIEKHMKMAISSLKSAS